MHVNIYLSAGGYYQRDRNKVQLKPQIRQLTTQFLKTGYGRLADPKRNFILFLYNSILCINTHEHTYMHI